MNEEYVLTITALDLGAVADVDHPSWRHAKSLGYEETD